MRAFILAAVLVASALAMSIPDERGGMADAIAGGCDAMIKYAQKKEGRDVVRRDLEDAVKPFTFVYDLVKKYKFHEELLEGLARCGVPDLCRALGCDKNMQRKIEALPFIINFLRAVFAKKD